MSNAKIYEIGKKLEAKGIPVSLLNNRKIGEDSNIDQVVKEIETEFNDINAADHKNEVESFEKFKDGLNSWTKTK